MTSAHKQNENFLHEIRRLVLSEDTIGRFNISLNTFDLQGAAGKVLSKSIYSIFLFKNINAREGRSIGAVC